MIYSIDDEKSKKGIRIRDRLKILYKVDDKKH